MSKALDSGKAFVEQVLAKLPESLRDAARTAFAAPEAADALTTVGDGVLARSDYSRLMDEVREKEAAITEDYTKLNGWYETNKSRLGQVETLEAEIARLQGKPPVTTPPPTQSTTPSGLSMDDLNKVLEDRDRNYAGVLAYTTSLATKHLRDFNEVLDVQAVIDNATKTRTSLDASYKTLYAEKLTTKARAEEDARINKQVEERLAERLKGQGDQPFPLRNQSPSVLDILHAKDDSTANHNLDSAVAEYERLQSAR